MALLTGADRKKSEISNHSQPNLDREASLDPLDVCPQDEFPLLKDTEPLLSNVADVDRPPA